MQFLSLAGSLSLVFALSLVGPGLANGAVTESEVVSGEVDPAPADPEVDESDAEFLDPPSSAVDVSEVDMSTGLWVAEDAANGSAQVPGRGLSNSFGALAAYREPPPGGGSIPWSRWAACGGFDSRYKVVRDYQRNAYHQRMKRRYARLYCGRRDSVEGESTFGYRHIKDRHSGEWQAKAAAMGRGWQDLAGWMMDWVTYDPDLIVNSSPKRFCYQRKFVYVVDGRTILKTRAVMLLGKTGVRIITFFPNKATGSGFCSGKGPVVYP
ncbi:MAG: hypothetical protein ACRCYQ_05635 [Nocardioides sp.]